MELAIFVFLVLPIFTQTTLTGHEDLLSCEAVLEAIKLKRSLPVLKWTSESEFIIILYAIVQSKSNHLTPRCACAARSKKQRIVPSLHFAIDRQAVL